MAAESGATRAAVESESLERQLAEAPFEFDFFQAVRLIERLSEGRHPVGRFAQPRTECVRFGVHNTNAFPASEIQGFEWREEGPARMLVNFMGLTGPQGQLPLYYTQLVAERTRARDTAMRDFFDIFNHRMLALFYRAWEKYRFTVEFERSGADPVSRNLLDLVGLGTNGLSGRQAVADHSLVYYSGLIAPRTRSAQGLKQLLEDYFDVDAEIEQFAGAWYTLNPDTQCCLEREDRSASEQLALGAVVGDEIWSEQGRVRIRLGPLTLERYLDFLPTGSAYEPLRALARFYGGDELDFEVQLVLKKEEVPGCELGREDECAPRLGHLTWAKSAPMGRNPEETILQL